MLIYPVTLIPDDNDTFLVEFPDIPEANSVGDDEQEALLNAEDALCQWPLFLTHFWPIKLTHPFFTKWTFSASVDNFLLPT